MKPAALLSHIRRSNLFLFSFSLLLGAAFVAAVGSLGAQTPTCDSAADYTLQNTRSSSVGTAPALTDLGAGNTFVADTVDGVSRTVLRFPYNNGVQLQPTTGTIANDSYTVVMLFRFDSVGSYGRILEFKNGTGDTGLYVFRGGLHFFGADKLGATPIPADTYVQVALSRTATGTVTGYVNGIEQWSFIDSSNLAVIDSNNALRFFQDNTSGGSTGESSAGAVARIRLYNCALTADEVAALDRLPAPPANISGTITYNGDGLAGVSVTLSGAQSGTTTTDADGRYSFSNLEAGDYAITPSKVNFGFTPDHRDVSLSGTNQTADFTASSTAPVVHFSSASYGVTEGSSAVLTVTRDGDISQTVTVDYATANGSATGLDYTATSGTFTFDPGVRSGTISISTTDDTIYEGSEDFTVSLSNVTGLGATLGSPSSGTVTIDDNDAAPVIELESGSYTVDEGAGHVTVAVTKTGDTSVNATVQFGVSGSTATQNADFTDVPQTVTFAPNETRKTIDIPINEDSTYEGNELFQPVIGSPGNATLGTPTSTTVTITDNDPKPTVQFSSATYNVTEDGGTVTVTVTKSGSTALSASVHYAIADGTATAPADYASTSGDFTFAPNETAKTFTVAIAEDSIYEKDHSFTVALSTPNQAIVGTVASAVITIADNDPAPTVQFNAGNFRVDENSPGFATLTLTKTGLTELSATVNYATSDGPAALPVGAATQPADYDQTSSAVTFLANEMSKEITVPINDDAIFERDEQFSVTLSSPQDATLGTTSAATTTIVENDPMPVIQFSAADYPVNEASSQVTITVTKTGATAVSSSVSYATSDGTATASADYSSASGSLTFDPADTSKTFTVTLNPDTLYETSEQFNLTLTSPTDATLGTESAATTSITDDDPAPVVEFSAATYSVNESGTNATLTVTKTGSTAVNAVVHYATGNASATATSDYTATSLDLTFAPNETSKQVTIPIANDNVYEGDEEFVVTLTAVGDAAIGTQNSATVTIVENDPLPTLQFSSMTYSVNEGSATATLTVTKTGNTAFDATVNFTTSDGSAKASGDYTTTSGTLTFLPGDTSKDIIVPITNDSTFEGNESFTVSLSTPGTATLGSPSGVTVTIVENDAPPVIEFVATTHNVGEGDGTVTIAVTKTGATALDATVHYATSNGSATVPSDYANTAGDLVFAPGETSKEITISIANDAVFENSEIFNLTLTAPTNSSLGSKNAASVSITDNDPAPVVQFSAPTYNSTEGGGTATLTINKTGATAVAATVHYATSDGTATAGSDYTGASGDVTFAPNETAKDITVPITNDSVFEGGENFTVTLSAPSGASLGAGSSAAVAIADDDPAPSVQFSAASYSTAESSGNVTIVVTKTGSTALSATVHYATSNGSATAPADYAATSGDLTFAPNETTKQFTIALVDDTEDEGNESFNVALSGPGNATLNSPAAATVTIADNDAPTPTPTPSPSPTPTATATSTATATATPTATPTVSASASPTATPSPTPTATPAQALNISTRLGVELGDRAMIGGFIIRGDLSKPVVLRGMGPSLVDAGVPAAAVLTDPLLELHGPDGSLITSNDNWKESSQRSQIESTIFQPTDDREAVILATLPPGNYTVILRGSGGTRGIGLVEVYDNDKGVASDLANISTRGFVKSADEVMIGGFILGNDPRNTGIAIRGLGPSLSQFGLSGVLEDPILELHNANGSLMIANDNWTDDTVSAAQLTANGLALSNPKEAGIFTSLPPGNFTAILAGKDGTMGIGLVEIYDVR